MTRKPFDVLGADPDFEDWFKQSGDWHHEATAGEGLYSAWLMLRGAGVGPVVAGAAMNAVVETVKNEYGE